MGFLQRAKQIMYRKPVPVPVHVKCKISSCYNDEGKMPRGQSFGNISKPLIHGLVELCGYYAPRLDEACTMYHCGHFWAENGRCWPCDRDGFPRLSWSACDKFVQFLSRV